MSRIKSKRALWAILLLAMLALCPMATAGQHKHKKKTDGKVKTPAKKASKHKKSPSISNQSTPTHTPMPTPTPSPTPSPQEPVLVTPPPSRTQEVCRTYTVKSGDSAMSVAQAEGIDYDRLVAALAQCIGYTDGAILQVGQAVCLPPFTPSCKYVTTSGASSCKVYTVQAGDTVDSISKAFNLYPQTLIDVNEGKISSKDPVQPGFVIRLPPWDTAVCKDPDANAPACRIYYVKPGDTIFSVASTFGLSSEAVISVNSGLNVNSPLSVGQPLRLPPFPASCGNQGTIVTGPSGGASTNCRSYVVANGDSLSSIATQYGSTSQEVLSINPQIANAQALTVGTRIKLPPWDDSCPPNGYVVNQSPVTGPPVVLIPNPPGVPVTQQPVITTPAPPPVQVNRPVLTSSPPVAVIAVTTPAAPTPKTAPAPSTTAPPPSIDVEMILQGASSQDFGSKQAAVVQALAQAAGVPVEAVSVRFVLGITLPSRRLLSPTDVVKVQCTIQGNPVSVQTNLEQSVRNNSLSSAMQAQGLTLKSLTTISSTGEVTTILSPNGGTAAAISSDKHVSKYIIIGASVGGGIVLLLITIGCCQVAGRRKRQRELEEEEERVAAAVKARYIGANAYVSTVSKKKMLNGSFSDGHMISSENHVRAPARTPSRGPRASQQQSSSGESLPGMPVALQQAAREAYAQPIDVAVLDRSAESNPQQCSTYHQPQRTRNQQSMQQPLQESSSAKSVTFETYAPPGPSPPPSPKLSPKKHSSTSRVATDALMIAPSAVPMVAAEESSTSPEVAPPRAYEHAPLPRITTVNTTATLRASSVSPPPSPEMRRAISRGVYGSSDQISTRGSVRSEVTAPVHPPSSSVTSSTRIATASQPSRSQPSRSQPSRSQPSRSQRQSSSPSRLPRVATLSSSPEGVPASRRSASPPKNPSPRSRSAAAPLPRVATLDSSSRSSQHQQPAGVPRASYAPVDRVSSYTRQSSSSGIPGSLRSKMGVPPPTQPSRATSMQPSPRNSPTRTSRRSLYGDL